MDCVVLRPHTEAAIASVEAGVMECPLGGEYQPLVAVSNAETCAYQALARFRQGLVLRSSLAGLRRLKSVGCLALSGVAPAHSSRLAGSGSSCQLLAGGGSWLSCCSNCCQ